MQPESRPANALGTETSPYLLAHAHQPVDWQPWGEAALARARREDKPILLSIGYSACHWCHVMARESFDDAATAALMNAHFVNVKVDREERPDVDRVYQLAHQLLTGRPGGWPLTLFLDPEDGAPFHGGTYFPPTASRGLPGFRELLGRLAELWAHRRAALRRQGQVVREALARLEAPAAGPGVVPGPEALERARQEAANHFDPRDGGFGSAPKFPHPASLERVMRHYALSLEQDHPDDLARHMFSLTLERMALGGINDQLAGGFARYAVDAGWMLPHFEKMLGDNGALLALYAQAARLTGRPLFAATARSTADWALREMRAPEGGFYASLDAESAGVEGGHCLWTRAEVQAALTAEEYALIGPHLGFDRAPNAGGRWYPHVFVTIEELAARRAETPESISGLLDRARARLLAVREQRARPARDEKILTAWNALMVKGLALAGLLLDRPDWLRAAEQTVDFLRAKLWREGRLAGSWKDGQARFDGCVDDYAYLLDALLCLLQARWRDADLAFARELADGLVQHFEDGEHGGFLFTAADHEALIARPRSESDDALPAGGGVAAAALTRLGHLLGESRYLEAAERALAAAAPALERAPLAHCALLSALEEHCFAPEMVVLRGANAALEPWLERARAGWHPRRLVFAIAPDAGPLPGLLAERAPRAEVTAYVCRGTRCLAPVTDLEAFGQALQGA